jgi:gliding motility-associated lipoprotein GldH
MKEASSLLILTVLLLLLWACSGKYFYEKMDSLPNGTWHKDSLLYYDFDITDSMQYYNIYINVRNTINYETQYFYIFLHTFFPNGITGCDTLGCILCDPYGKWTGKGLGHIKENHFLYRKNVRFPRCGHYRIGIEQAMRSDTLKGISDFGISLSYYKKGK